MWPLLQDIVSLAYEQSDPKRHLDRLSCFCHAHSCDEQTDRQTDTHTQTTLCTISVAAACIKNCWQIKSIRQLWCWCQCGCSKDCKTLTLHNTTLLPVAWRLTGLENLGDDFSVSQELGVIQPKTDFALNVYFRALKPVTTNRKAVRIEVLSLCVTCLCFAIYVNVKQTL